MTRPTVAFVLTFALALLSLGAIVSVVAGQDTKQRQKFDPARDAAQDIVDATIEAQSTGKRIILDVGGEWCIWFHKLDKFFDEHADVAQFLDEHDIVVKANYSKENKNKEVLSRYPAIKGYPHLFVLDIDGTLLHSRDTGQRESGDHHDRDKVFAFLKEWASPKGS